MSVYSGRRSSDKDCLEAIKYLLNKHRDNLQIRENKRRQELKNFNK